ncbi:MAG TPA: hypothetical protein DCG19_01305 [Cryomorphaceae bacterium]|nr:hypothetical protein [Owenweeksia sp.]MBF99950.1 hypothetical protein [Owenweeksia sp.]HAD96006.1 hypothetical protein [Cryomorphaceae bacterium]HBF20228.1 hypothetical protein [Cryomorphaceae bacterium]|tara:strand:+ start:88 stop:450 length:363 start_codon:yes stop_codon:yes gene_type:complete
MSQKKGIEGKKPVLEIVADSRDAVFIERYFTEYTQRDLQIQQLPIPQRPFWLRVTVKSIRLYRKHLSRRLGNRCVFDPSCSHYAEQAFREKGFYQGIKLTLSRLRRCNPSNGGTDLLKHN